MMNIDSLLGNTEAVAAVRQMLVSGRVSGALLFAGADGVGKKTLALMLAKALNCERRPPEGDSFCGECPHCLNADQMLASTQEDLERRRSIKDSSRRVEGLIYFDLQLIEPITRFILIEQVRQLRAVAYTHPFEFSRRIFVVDQAQTVHWQAADLLLKVLEEPPPTSLFILVCPNAHELRPTIRSRCRQIQFLPVETGVIEALLAREGRIDAAHRKLAARVAGGSVAKALTFELAGFLSHRRPWLDFLDSLAGKSRDPSPEPDWKRLFDSTRALTEKREEFEETLRTGYTLLRDLMQILLGGRPEDLSNVDLIPQLEAWARKLGLARIERIKAGLDQAYRLQSRNVNQQLGLDALATELFLNPSSSPTTASRH
jgi:DNA polymerase III subunit delta'